jgi:hypothetical protein
MYVEAPHTMNTATTTTGAENITAAQQFNDRGEELAIWVIVAESARNRFRWCVLGDGFTEREAWRIAYGNQGRPRRGRAWAEHISYEHYDRLQQAEANA